LASVLGTLACIGVLHGWDAMLKHWWENTGITILVTASVLVVVYGPQFIWTAIDTVHKNHQTLVATVDKLSKAPAIKDQEIKTLKAKLSEQCYNPDRYLTPEDRDSLHDSLRSIALSYGHPVLDVGFYQGDSESERFMQVILNTLTNAGFRKGDVIVRPPKRVASDPADLGAGIGLSITEPVASVDPTDQGMETLSVKISDAFNQAHLKMARLPAGPGYTIPIKLKRLIVWIGFKEIVFP
jgi:hypothetical protein